MVTEAILKKHGVTAEAWQKKLAFTRSVHIQADKDGPVEELKPDEALVRLHNRIRSRVQKGRDYNLLHYRTIQALDLIWEAPFRQITPTLVADLIRTHRVSEGPHAEKEFQDALHAVGLRLDDIMIDTGEVNKDGQKVKALNVPAFYTVLVPLVRAYLEIRRAKIVNDRNITPFHKFESPVSDPVQRLKCDVITSRIEVMRQQYGYLETLKQAVFQMLLYGTCLQFTMEAWHYEEQMKLASEEDVKRYGPESKKKIALGDEITYTAKEGLRYFHGHPSRTFFDQAHPCWTFNTDTGCEYGGFWRVVRFKEVWDNPAYFNKDRIQFGGGSTAWWANNANFFNAVYNTCVMAWPAQPTVPDGTQDREKWLAENSTYNETLSENSVVLTEYREKIIPSEYGLGDYDYPIWARFVLAGDDSTIIYAEPLCYQAIVAYRYNGDDRKTEDASLGLQLIPSQDMLSNLVSQFIYTAKQNLANMTLVDSRVVDKGMMATIKNLGERMFRSLNIFPFDGSKLFKMQANATQAIYSHRFPQQDTNGILASIKLVLDLAERILQFSNQEVAQAATHEQTRREVEMIQGSTTNILQFTGSPVDEAMKAQARQLYEATMAYGDDDFYAQIPFDHALDTDELDRLGITYVWKPGQDAKRTLVRVKKSALDLVYFAIVPSYQDRANNVEQGRALNEMVRDWFINNPMGQSALGPEQLVDLFNQITSKLFKLPLDSPIKNVGLRTQEQNAVMQQQLQTIGEGLLKESKEGMLPILDQMKQLSSAVVNLYQQLNLPPPNATPVPENPPQTGAVQSPPAMVG